MSTTAPPASHYHHGNLRQALLDAAVHELRRKGPDQLSLRAIARAIGVSQTAPYRHFVDKNDLLMELAAQAFDELADVTRTAMVNATSSGDRLYLSGHAYIDYALGNPEKYRLMLGQYLPVSDNCDRLRCAGDESFNVLLEVIRAGVNSGELIDEDPTLLAIHCWTSIHGLASLLIDERAHCSDMPITQAQLIDANLRLLGQRIGR
ncbi:TetR/AcrR family transcriptional regulator [Candidatus Thalassolituus haligoni]|jgi:AcrR family transcriptional regulator|uniref:TetR/AcrR family transcriptional regulator n=1 Tax=Candidatus Thalassolituus haligoni TaxID=3100113 RepID=UPI003519728F|tara:strand:- start:10819 stop:11436 length:618 start_codon:yes stop_codon:yes gene_type:complete